MIESSKPLENPERTWERAAQIDELNPSEIERRIGKVDSTLQVLSGGQANLNVLVGDDRVLRIYRRDPATLRKESVLLRKPWSSFQVPAILREGDDFLLMEFVAHGPLSDSEAHGATVGEALAEIHSQRYLQSGFLGPDLTVREPLTDFVDALRGHVASQFQKEIHRHFHDIEKPVRQFLDLQAEELRSLATNPVLLHGDFKPANLHWSSIGKLLVLDWEFAYAGPSLMDIGQLIRWDAPPRFRDAFAEGYRSAGGHLPDDWQRWARVFDLFNFVGLLGRAEPGSRRGSDITRQINQTMLSLDHHAGSTASMKASAGENPVVQQKDSDRRISNAGKNQSSLSEQYERQDGWRRWDDALKLLPIFPGQQVLDLGCGVGQISKRLSQLGARVIGIDQDDELLAAAHRNHPGIRFENVDLKKLSSEQFGKVDGIWSSFVPAYFTQLTPILSQWRECLVVGGWIALVEVDDLFGHGPIPSEVAAHVQRFYDSARADGRYDFESGRQLSTAVKDAGFTIIHEGVLADDELSFQGPAKPDVLNAWALRLRRMGGLKKFFGERFPDFEAKFLNALSSPEHSSKTRVCMVIARND